MLTPTGSSFQAPATTRGAYSRQMSNAALSQLDADLTNVRRFRAERGPAASDLEVMVMLLEDCVLRLDRAAMFAAEEARHG